MTALFIGVTIFGIVEVVSLLAISTVFRQSGRGDIGFQLMAQAAGFVAAGVGGLAMVLADIGTPGFSIVTVIALGLVLALIYKVAIPYAHRRWPGVPEDPAENRVNPG